MKIDIFLIIVISVDFAFINQTKIKIKLKSQHPLIRIGNAFGKLSTDPTNQFFDKSVIVKDILVDREVTSDKVFIALHAEGLKISQEFPKYIQFSKIKIYKRPFFGNSHEFLVVCGTGDNSDFYFHVDKGSFRYKKTKVNINYFAKEASNDCNGDAWKLATTLKEDGEADISEKYKNVFTFLHEVIYYAKQFKNYELFGTNCQHFATGIFNKVTGKSTFATNCKITKNRLVRFPSDYSKYVIETQGNEKDEKTNHNDFSRNIESNIDKVKKKSFDYSVPQENIPKELRRRKLIKF